MSDLPNLAADPELLAGFFDESQETLGTLDALFIRLEAAPGDLGIIEAIFRPIHSLKGNSAFFGFMEAKRLAHEMETLLDHVRKGRMQASRAVIDVLLAGTDALKAIFLRLRAGGPEVDDPAALAALIDRVTALSGVGSAPPAEDASQALKDIEILAAALGSTAGPGVRAALARLRRRRDPAGRSACDDADAHRRHPEPPGCALRRHPRPGQGPSGARRAGEAAPPGPR